LITGRPRQLAHQFVVELRNDVAVVLEFDIRVDIGGHRDAANRIEAQTRMAPRERSV